MQLAIYLREGLIAKYTSQKAVELLLAEGQASNKPPSLDTPGDFTIARNVILETSEGVSNAATKTSMLMTTNPDIAGIKKEAGISLCNAMQKPCEQLVTAMTVLCLCKTDILLAMYYARAVRSVLECVARLFSQCAAFAAQAEPSSMEEVSKALLPLTGSVWAASKAVQDLPLSNRVVFKRDMMEKVDVIKDTISEFRELCQRCEENPGAENAVSMEDDDEKYTLEDYNRTKKCLEVMDLLMGVCKGSVKCVSMLPKDNINNAESLGHALKDMNISSDGENVFRCSSFARAKDLHMNVAHISEQMTDLGCSLYPSHDVEEIGENAEALVVSGKKLFASILISGVVDDAQKAGLQRMENKLVVYIAEIQEAKSL